MAMMPSSPNTKSKPMIYLSWPKKGLKTSGDMKALRIGKSCVIRLKGTVKGLSEREDGRSLDIEPSEKNLGRQLEGLVKRLAQPLEGQPPVTTDQLTYLRGRQDENTELLSFPARARLLWQQEREQLDQFRQQRASSLHAPPRR